MEDCMRFSYAESMIDPMFYLPLARTCEDSGWSSMIVPDSICYPAESSTKYPYNADGTREFLEGKPFIEPFSLIPAMAAVTETLRFTTFVIKLPIRHPVLAAKQATSTAVITNNRLALGVGTSPWPEDFEVTGTQWKRRGKRMDEMIEIMRGLFTGEFYEFHGEFYDIPKIKICPTPSEPLPIMIGGHSDAALRRAARSGDGWMHGGGNEELGELLAKLAAMRSEYGRANEPFEIHVISMDGYSVDGVKRLEDLGVTDAIVGFRDAYAPGPDPETLEHKQDCLKRFADDVISKV
jgi:probable F420-dependent oxidoreductase